MATTYNGSKATQAMGTVASIGPIVTTTGTIAYTPIAEILSVEFSGAKTTILNTTNMESGNIAEKQNSIVDYGNVKITANRIPTDPGQLALAAAFATPGKYLFQVQLPIDAEVGQTTTGDLYAFTAIVSDGTSFSLDPTKITTVSYTLEISGAVAYTAGS